MSMIPIGWDCYSAMNAQSPTPSGGRTFNMASIPFGLQDAFAVYHGATRAAQMQTFLVDIVRWLRGGRSFGTVACSPIGDTIDYGWYPDGENETLVGSGARAALTGAGFTVIDYGPQKTADNYFNGADVVIFDEWSNSYGTGDPVGQISPTQSAPIWDYVVSQDRSMLFLTYGNCAPGFGSNTQYAYQVGYHQLYDYAGSEAIFGNTFDGGQTFGPQFWGGGMTVGAGIVNMPAYGLTYPSTKLAGWRNATNSYHRMVYSAFSNHEDIGSFGDSWV